jgi:formylglycine-generating enzyme required for sulfatase activity
MTSPPETQHVRMQSSPMAGEGTSSGTPAVLSRPRTILLPDIAWVDIASGDFIYQQGERRSLPAFRIARYPVTNIQYQTFIDAGAYDDQRWWQDLQRPQPEASTWPHSNRPRTNVDWYEAMAFCRWLSVQLRYEVRLPTEEEWERAARGVEGREYPWGKGYESGRANVNETDGFGERVGNWFLDQTTAVGVYSQGASSEGVLDLSGNVWEWCLNKYEHPEQIRADESGQTRVLRGGSWHGAADFASGSRRVRLNPDDRSDLNGFRVVSSAPIA